MSFADYWYQKQRTNPALVKSDRLTITVESLRKELEKAYEFGRLEKARDGGAFGEIFGSMFGK